MSDLVRGEEARSGWSGDVVIVGGGLSGLAAARALGDSRRVVVLEARAEVGGRMVRRSVADGRGWVDLGGQWLGPTQLRMWDLANRLGLERFPWHHEGKSRLKFDECDGYVGPDFTRIDGEPYPLTEAEWEDYHMLKVTYEDLATRVPPDRPWTWDQAPALDGVTLARWLDQQAATPFGYWTVATLARIGGSGAFEPEDTSPLHFLWTQLVAAQREDPEVTMFYGGAGQIPSKLVEQFKGNAEVRCNQRVKTIQHDSGGVRVSTFDQRIYDAPHVIVALPPPIAGKIEYAPELPPKRRELTKRSVMGAIIKVHAIYSSPFWRAQELSGIGQGNLPTIEFTADSSEPEAEKTGKPGILTAFIAGKRAIELSKATPGDRRDAVLADYVTYFGPEAGRPDDFIEANWPMEPCINGAFTSYMPPGVWTAYGEAIREPIGRIHWAGTETATSWPGYFDGALQSAERAVAEVLGH
jgi:monoamine oxidase